MRSRCFHLACCNVCVCDFFLRCKLHSLAESAVSSVLRLNFVFYAPSHASRCLQTGSSLQSPTDFSSEESSCAWGLSCWLLHPVCQVTEVGQVREVCTDCQNGGCLQTRSPPRGPKLPEEAGLLGWVLKVTGG